MRTEVRELISLDVYRDGGSLSVSYRDQEGTQHELIFSIDNFASDQSNDMTIYKSASIETFVKSDYVSPVTGLSTSKTEIDKHAISWETAKDVLEKIGPLMAKFKSEYQWVYKSMVTIVGNEHRAIKYS